MSPRRSSLLSAVVAVALALGVAFAAGDGARDGAGIPLPVWGVIIAFGINWAAFVPSYLARTEAYYDLTGSLTYLTVTGVLLAAGGAGARAVLVAALVAIWAARLGSFLFSRIRADGHDGRFDKLKTDPWLFWRTWTLQGLWVSLTLAAGMVVLAATDPADLGVLDVIGVLLWLIGFGMEAVADHQKRRFRSDPANQGRFIDTGLWAWSRHPNYFGEITLWTAIAVIALGDMSGWQYVALISPVFVYVLLTRISGIPLLERRAARRWGENPEYQAYVARTPVLVPRPPRR